MIEDSSVGEGDVEELIMPLVDSKMQPFVDAIVNKLNVQGSNNNQAPIQFIVADEMSLKRFERKLELIRLSENKRRGI